VKTSKTRAPDVIPEDHFWYPSDSYAIEGPGVEIDWNSPRFGMEREWFEVLGVVTHVKLEPDGDLHVQLRDDDAASNSTAGYLIVEVPKGSPWCAIRRQILSWTTATFPKSVSSGRNLTMTSHPLVSVVGRAFYDGVHAPGGNRRRTHAPRLAGYARRSGRFTR
jgi:hypothetical protein